MGVTVRFTTGKNLWVQDNTIPQGHNYMGADTRAPMK